jgi:hypothetical protein
MSAYNNSMFILSINGTLLKMIIKEEVNPKTKYRA